MPRFFYHIDHKSDYAKKPLLIEGDVVDTRLRLYNPFYESAMDFQSSYNTGDGVMLPLCRAFQTEAVKRQAQFVISDHAPKIMARYIKLVRELVFENHRRENYEALPSRTRCLWLSETEDEARYWVERLEDRIKPQILRVSVDGILHKAYEGHLQEDSQSMEQLLMSAEEYWSGETSGTSRSETLFEGKMTVLEVVPY